MTWKRQRENSSTNKGLDAVLRDKANSMATERD